MDIILKSLLKGLDEDLLEYVTSIIAEMTIEEKKSEANIKDSIGPFLTESGFFDTSDELNACCKW